MDPDLKRTRTPVFCGVAEPLVDEVLDHLSDADKLPARCLVLGTDMNLLGALCRQWSGQVEVVVVVMPHLAKGMLDAAMLVALNEGCLPEDLVWVGGRQAVGDMGAEPVDAVDAQAGDALNLARQIARKLRA